MKRIGCMLIAVMVCVSSQLCADETAKKAGKAVQALIDDGLFKNQKKIEVEAIALTDEQKAQIIEDNKKSAWPVVFNIAFGFGIGSWVEGDKVGGLVGTIGDASTVGILLFGTAAVLNSDSLNDSTSDAWTATSILLVAAKIGVDVFQIIRASTYPHFYNTALEEAVNGSDNEVSFQFVPGFTFDENSSPQLALACRVNW